MGWLFDNFLADMRGPDFLIFYAIFAVVVLAAAYAFIAHAGHDRRQAPPPTPRRRRPL